MTIYRPKAREMAGFNKNWDTENVVGTAAEKRPRARERREGFADFGEPVRDDDDEYQVDDEAAIAEHRIRY